MTDHAFHIRPMTLADLEWALTLAKDEGWNPGLSDAATFFTADPHGFFVGMFEDQPVACISAVTYGKAFGFLGLYLVKKEFRGRGFGIQIWRKAMHYLGQRTVGLDGVVAQQENYRKSGFQLAYRNVRYQGHAMSGGGQDAVVDATKVPWDVLQAYDLKHFGAPRPEFLRRWLEHAHVRVAHWQDGTLRGYAVLRRCHVGFKFGPLFAENEVIADALFQSACARVQGETIFLDIPEPNAAAGRLVTRHGMEPVFETARMYTGTLPALPLDEIFGVTTFELG